MSLTIGVDVGGTKIAAGVVDDDEHIVAQLRRETPSTDPVRIGRHRGRTRFRAGPRPRRQSHRDRGARLHSATIAGRSCVSPPTSPGVRNRWVTRCAS